MSYRRATTDTEQAHEWSAFRSRHQAVLTVSELPDLSDRRAFDYFLMHGATYAAEGDPPSLTLDDLPEEATLGIVSVVDEYVSLFGDPGVHPRFRALPSDAASQPASRHRVTGGESSADDWVRRQRDVYGLAAAHDYDAVILALRDPHPRVAEAAAEALREACYAPAVPALIECLSAKSQNVRALAAYALREIGDERAVEPLIALLERLTSSSLRGIVADVLGAFGDTRALPVLQALTNDEDVTVRNKAQGAIFRIEPPWTCAPPSTR